LLESQEACTENHTENTNSNSGFSSKALAWWQADSAPLLPWRANFRKNYQFYAGKQSDAPSTPAKPQIIFNRVRPIIDAVCGAQLSSPRDIIAIPRVPPEQSANEAADGASDLLKWFREKSRAAEAEAQAFRDALVGGIGFVSVNLDWQRDPHGAPVYEALNPLEMAWPATAWDSNLRAARRLWRITWHDADALREMFPHAAPEQYGFPCGDGWGSAASAETGVNSGASSAGAPKSQSGKLFCLAELRLMERAGSIWIDDNGNPQSVKPGGIKSIEVPQYRPRRYWLGAGGAVLGQSPVLAPNNSLGWHGLTCNSVTGENAFFGLLEGMKDAQKLLNRMVSQSLYSFDRQSKGGLIAERGAFENPAQAEKDWTRNDKIIWVKSGGIERVKTRQPDHMNDSLIALYTTANEAFAHLSGVSDEFMGTREIAQAGVLERERKQSTLNVLSAPFANLRSMRLAAAEDIIYLGKHWVSDTMLVRVDRQYKRVSRADLGRFDYDLYLDDAPSGENEKEEVFERIMKLAPMISQMRGGGVSDKIIAQILKYAPLPAGFTEGLERELSKEGAASAGDAGGDKQKA